MDVISRDSAVLYTPGRSMSRTRRFRVSKLKLENNNVKIYFGCLSPGLGFFAGLMYACRGAG